MLYEPRKHETKLRRWVTHFHSEIIFPIEQTHVDYLEQSGQQAEAQPKFELYCKYFELRPYFYAINWLQRHWHE